MSARGQKLNESQVPAVVKIAFEKKYPSAKASWDKEDANYEANFKQDGTAMSAVIDKNGTIVETETDIPVRDLPQSVQDYMKKNYPGVKDRRSCQDCKGERRCSLRSRSTSQRCYF
jgi:hypothetical protein